MTRPGTSATEPLKILQVNRNDHRGGAAEVAWGLHHALIGRGVDAHMAVARKSSNDPKVHVIPNDENRSAWVRWVRSVIHANKGSRFGRGLGRLRWAAEPRRLWNHRYGKDDFDYPGTWKLLDLAGGGIDIVHAHNLHKDYFDLRALPWLSERVTTILTLHDAWLASGHCAHSLACERWKTGCGQCPDLRLPPSVPYDSTAQNWEQKRRILERCRVYLTAPSKWLLNRIHDSILAPAVVGSRVITTGVDTNRFSPANPSEVRTQLGLPTNARVLLFAANHLARNPYKDFSTWMQAVRHLGSVEGDGEIIFVGLGSEGSAERFGRVEVRLIPYETDRDRVAKWFQAADLYVHPARVETFPLTVLQALAAGTPVVASDTGGIPEQILGLDGRGWTTPPNSTGGTDTATGILTPVGDGVAMANAIAHLLGNDEVLAALSVNARSQAVRRFDHNRYAAEMHEWYAEVAEHDPTDLSPGGARKGRRASSRPS